MPSEKDLRQAGYFVNRVAKRDRHLRKWARNTGTDCYRVYDRDIPEVPLSLDRYGEAAVLYLYERPYDKPEAEEAAWLELMAEAASSSLGVPRDAIVLKTRRRLGADEQYERLPGDDPGVAPGAAAARGSAVAASGSGVAARGSGVAARGSGIRERVVRENGLAFLVNLDDYIDTGLFMDHRPARELVRGMASGKSVLNLFCYTGSFSVYALAGGAARVTGVDLSNTYLAWAERTIARNPFDAERYRGIRADVSAFLESEAARGALYDIIVLDPPTFSNSKKMTGFLDISRHWPELLKACLAVLAPGGTILFSTNAKGLRLEPSLVPEADFKDVSDSTIPDGYRGRPHRTWLVHHRAMALEL